MRVCWHRGQLRPGFTVRAPQCADADWLCHLPCLFQKAFYHAARATTPASAEQRLELALDLIPADMQLRDLRFSDGETPVLIAIYSETTAVAALLIRQLAAAGADLEAAWQQGNVAPRHINYTPLQCAVQRKDVDEALTLVDALLEAGVSPHTLKAGRSRVTALMVASQGHAAVVQRLAQAGADVHARDADGLTALHWAARLNVFGEGARVVSALVAAGALVATADGLAVLHWAAGLQSRNEQASHCLRHHIRGLQVRQWHARDLHRPLSPALPSPPCVAADPSAACLAHLAH